MYLKLTDGTLVGRYSTTGKSNFSVSVTGSTVTDLDGVTTGTIKVKVSGNSGAYNCLLESALTATFSIVAPEDDDDDGDEDGTSDEASDGASEGTSDGDGGSTSADDGAGEEASDADDGSGDAASSDGGEADDASDAADAAGDGTGDAGDTVDEDGDGEGTSTVKAAKAKQALKVVKAATKTVKASKLKKRARTVKVIKKVTGAKGKVTYKKSCVYKGGSGVATVGRKIAVNSKTGKVTLKRGLAKGTYRVVIRVRAAATSKYKAATKVVTVKVKVK